MADTVRLLCPRCRTAYRLKVGVRPGATVKCSKCGAGMVVPEPAAAPPIARKSEFAGSSDDRQVSLAPRRDAPTLSLEAAAPDESHPSHGSHPSHPSPALAEEGLATVLMETPPQETARYIEQAVIGRGGMGEVALCIDRNTRRQVALKRILPHAASDPARRARFVEEAQVTAQLEHPNIVPVHELDRTPDGTIYFTMKLVKGRSLAEILGEMKKSDAGEPPLGKGGFPRPPSPKPPTFTRPYAPPPPSPYAPRGDERPDAPRPQLSPSPLAERGPGGEAPRRAPLPPSPSPLVERGRGGEAVPAAYSLSDLLQVFLKVCDGVAFAHSRGVIHRDLKPANIMVGEYGEVLVMDWGLAKILPPEGSNTFGRVNAPSPTAKPGEYPPEGIETFGREHVASDRHEEGISPTLGGSAMGTPAYMSPEQANGELDKIDPRSDIYSLGAILYEVLTLERAVEGETPMMLLANAARNRIVPIEKRAAGRHVPRELSAIAMKCLAKSRAARYRSVLDLRRDIALFLEGRSVSARPDTFAQAVVKLVKRNKGISVSVAVAAAVLVAVTVGFIINLRGERDRARASERRAVLNEQKAVASDEQRRSIALSASERFAGQAVRAADYYRWDEAEQRASDAEAVCPDGPWGLYARGRFAQLRNDHEKAVAILRQATECDPKNTVVKAALEQSTRFLTDLNLSLKQIEAAKKLAEQGGTAGDWQSLERLGESMMSLEKWREAEVAFSGALRSAEQATNIPPDDKKKITERIGNRHGEAKAWIACEGFYDSIKTLPAEEQVKRVEAKLSEVNGRAVKVRPDIKDGKWLGADLWDQPILYIEPLKGLPLIDLSLHGCNQVRDLSSLKGMPLTHLDCWATQVSDLSPLKGMPLTNLNCGGRTQVTNLGPLKGMPLTILNCGETNVSDLSPLKGMPLTALVCYLTQVSDLSPLKGMPLRSLWCGSPQLSDLSPLTGMHLTNFRCWGTSVRDLSPLKGMPLTELECGATQVSDLSPLKGMPLTELGFGSTIVGDLTRLKGLPLTVLRCEATKVSDLSPLKGMSLTSLSCSGTPVTDLGPLEGMKLEVFAFTPKNIARGIEIVRNMKSIREIGDDWGRRLKPEEFWRKYDAGEFSK